MNQTQVRPVTLAVKMDEPCLRLLDHNKPVYVPGIGHEAHRLCQIIVLRDGKAVEFNQDLGPSRNFKAEGFLLPGGMPPVETVGSLLDYAEKLREMKSLRVRRGIEYPNMLDKYRQQGEENWKRQLRISEFGKYVSRQRG